VTANHARQVFCCLLDSLQQSLDSLCGSPAGDFAVTPLVVLAANVAVSVTLSLIKSKLTRISRSTTSLAPSIPPTISLAVFSMVPETERLARVLCLADFFAMMVFLH